MSSNAEDFLIRLVESVSGPAAKAESAIGDLESKIDSQRQALSVYEDKLQSAAAKLRDLGEGTNGAVNIAAFRKQQRAVAEYQEEIDGARKALERLEGARGLANQVDSLRQGSQRATELQDALGGLEGPVGDTVGRFEQLTRVMRALGPAIPFVIVGLLVAALVALAAAATIAIAKATQLAIKFADAARNSRLLAESLAVNHKALSGYAQLLPKVQAQTGLAADKVQQLAVDLAKAKVPAQNMEKALMAMAKATAGGADADFLKKLQEGLKATGRVPAELATKMARFEDIARRKMLSLDMQGDTLKRSFAALFKDINIDPLLEGLSSLIGILDQNTASGRALKFLFETIFQPLIDGVAAALPVVRRMFLHVIIFALKAYIAVRQFLDTPAGAALLTGLKIVGVLLGGLFAASMALIGALAAPFVIAAAAIPGLLMMIGVVWDLIVEFFSWIGGAASGAWDWIASSAQAAWGAVSGIVSGAMAAVTGAIDSAVAWMQSLSFADIGKLMIDGLVQGILSAPGAVVDAITGVVGGAIEAAKALLRPGSPSKVFREFGVGTSLGFAAGIDQEADTVETSMREMVPTPDDFDAPSPKPMSAPGAKGGKSASFTFSNCVFGGDLTKEKLAEWMREIFHAEELEPEPAP